MLERMCVMDFLKFKCAKPGVASDGRYQELLYNFLLDDDNVQRSC